jgi:hypothetical protein
MVMAMIYYKGKPSDPSYGLIDIQYYMYYILKKKGFIKKYSILNNY